MSLLLIGDSMLEASMAYLPAAFAALVPSAEVAVEAHIGATTGYWLGGDQIQALVNRYNPSVVVLVLGTNDGGAGGPAYESLVKRAVLSAGRPVIWVGPFNTDADARGRWASIQRVVGSSVDGLGLVQGLERADDGLHLRMGAYRMLAERLAKAIVDRTGTSGSSGGAMLVPLAIGALVALLAAWAWSN